MSVKLACELFTELIDEYKACYKEIPVINEIIYERFKLIIDVLKLYGNNTLDATKYIEFGSNLNDIFNNALSLIKKSIGCGIKFSYNGVVIYEKPRFMPRYYISGTLVEQYCRICTYFKSTNSINGWNGNNKRTNCLECNRDRELMELVRKKRIVWTNELVKSEGYKLYGDSMDYSKVINVIDNSSIITIVCNTCNHEYERDIYSHLCRERGCTWCSGRIVYNFDIFVEKARKTHGNKYDYSRVKLIDAIRSLTSVPIKCNDCEYEFNQVVDTHINGGSGCSQCANMVKYNYDYFVKKAKEIHGLNYNYDKIKILEKITANTTVIIICNKCLHEFEQKVRNHINTRSGCWRCHRSHGEVAVELYLSYRGFVHEIEYSLPMLPKKRFDFAIHGRKYLIEFDGEQHFKFNDYFFESNEKFEERKNIDIIKSVEAIKYGYTIVRIGYNIRDIDSFLDYAFNCNERLIVSDIDLYREHMEKVSELLYL